MAEKSNLIKIKKCPVCDNNSFADVLEAKSEYVVESDDNLENKFRLVRCDKCGFVFVNPQPKGADLQQYYPETCPNYDTSFKTFPEKILNKITPNNKSAKIHQCSGGRKKVLDVGFGQGDYLNEKHREGWECYGVDFSENAMDAALKKNSDLKLHLGSIKTAAYDDNFFDLVNASHVLEHVPDPLGTLQEVQRVLKHGGVFILDLPNFEGLYYSLAGKHAEYFVPQHLNFFSPITLAAILKKAGFKDPKVQTKFGNNLSYHILHRIGIQKSFYRKSVLNQLLGLLFFPIEVFFNKGDVIYSESVKK